MRYVEVKQEEVKQEKVKQEEVKQDGVNQEEVKQEEAKQEKVKQDVTSGDAELLPIPLTDEDKEIIKTIESIIAPPKKKLKQNRSLRAIQKSPKPSQLMLINQ